MPFIQLYGCFVILHGHLSPGGGFPGGAILGASLILYTLAFGLEKGRRKMPEAYSKKVESGAILVYVALGISGVAVGGMFLTNRGAGFPMGEWGGLLSGGFIPLLTLAVGMKVAATMIALFQTMIEEEKG